MFFTAFFRFIIILTVTFFHVNGTNIILKAAQGFPRHAGRSASATRSTNLSKRRPGMGTSIKAFFSLATQAGT